MGIEATKRWRFGLEWREIRPKLALAVVLFVSSKLISVIRILRKSAQQKKQLPFPNIPYTVPNPHWLLGHLGAMGVDVVEGQKRLCVLYAGPNGVSTFWQLNIPVISFLRAQDVSRVLQFSSERIQIPSLAKHYVRLLGRNTLIMASGKEWRANRNIVHRAFLDQALEDAQASIVQTAHRFENATMGSIQRSGGALTMDILELTKMASLDKFGLAALEYDFGCTADNKLTFSDVIQTFEFLTNDCNRRCYSFKARLDPCAQYYWIPTPGNLKNRREVTKLRKLLLGIVRERRSQIEANVIEATKSTGGRDETSTKRRGGLLDHLLRGSVNSLGQVDLTDEYLSDFLITMLFGGFESTSLSLCYALYLLIRHPKTEQECLREARRVLGTYPSMSSEDFNALKDLPYCCAVLYEATRLFPPVFATSRNLVRAMDVEVDGQTVQLPQKSRVFLSLASIHHYEKNFARADEFLPERWVEQKLDGTWTERPYDPEEPQSSDNYNVPAANRKNFFVFSAGARSCVGERFAMREAPTTLAFFLRSFKAELVDPNYRIKLIRTGPTQVPEGGIPVTIRRRDE